MSANLSSWLMEGIDAQAIAETDLSSNGGISLLSTDSGGYTAYYSNAYSDWTYNNYSVYSKYNNYYDYYNYSVYGNYYNYSVYGNYHNYSNYSNTTSITTNPTDQSVELGNMVTFSISASNASVITAYQWYKADSNTATGIAISGATSASYQFTPSINDDGKYFYCIATAPGGTVTSSRALLTVKSLNVYDIATVVDKDMNLFIKMTPASSTITEISSSNSNIASVTSEGTVRGITSGDTTIKVTSSNGISKTINIKVLPIGSANELEVLFRNLSIAIKVSKNITDPIKPDQMYNILNSGDISSKTYNNLGELLTDIASIIKIDETQKLYPKDFYNAILNKNN